LVACLVVLLLGALSPGLANASSGSSSQPCRHGDRGRLLGFERVASYPTAPDAQAYFDAWVEFYRDYYQFPPDLTADIRHGFDSYKVTYCTVDVAPPGRARPAPVAATGNLSVPRKAGPLATVAYLHGTSVSFYDAPSNPNIAGELSAAGESFDGPPSSAVFAGAGLIYVAPDYLGLGDSAVPRHRYFHAATEASSAADLLAASGDALARLRVRRGDELFTFGFSLSALANDTVVTVPLYVSYLLLAYDDIYDLFDRPAEVFRQPYAATVAGLFDMRHYFDDVVAALPPTSRELLRPSFLQAVLENRDHPLRVRLRQNAVDRWRPDAPIRVYHSPDDEEVAFGDMLVSVDRLGRRGADVTVRRVPGHHVTSWVRAMPRAAAYFRKLS